jgi:hypothetical protein
LVFEAHLKLPGYRSFAPLDRAYVHSLTARCNGYALNTLRLALDYVARTPVDRIEINRGYLADLTTSELARERKLTEQVLAFFVSVRERCGLASELAEGFENSWTASPRDVETMVPVN